MLPRCSSASTNGRGGPGSGIPWKRHASTKFNETRFGGSSRDSWNNPLFSNWNAMGASIVRCSSLVSWGRQRSCPESPIWARNHSWSHILSSRTFNVSARRAIASQRFRPCGGLRNGKNRFEYELGPGLDVSGSGGNNEPTMRPGQFEMTNDRDSSRTASRQMRYMYLANAVVF